MVKQAQVGVKNIETGEEAHLSTENGVTLQKCCHCQGLADGFSGIFAIGNHKIIIKNGFVLSIDGSQKGEFLQEI
jgi:hypothetical protein